MKLTPENIKDLRVGSRLRFSTRTVWEVVQIVERGIVVHMLPDGSHKSLLEWAYLEGYAKQYGDTQHAAVIVA